jgi:hypothetical protein
VTNTGKVHLSNVVVKDPGLDFDDVSIGALSPGETRTVFMQSNMKGEQMSSAEAIGIPVYPGTQQRLPGTSSVRAEDDAGVEIIAAERLPGTSSVRAEDDAGVEIIATAAEIIVTTAEEADEAEEAEYLCL